MANGNGAAVRSARPTQDEEEENIFIFYPNLIGMSLVHNTRSLANKIQATPASSSP